MEYRTTRFWRRILSFIFDLLMINTVILWPFQKVLEKYSLVSSFSDLLTTDTFPMQLYYIFFIISLLALCYFAFFEYYLGQTPGQLLFDIHVIAKDGRLTLWRCIVRNIFILPLFPFYIFWIIEPIHMIFTKDRLLERITHTQLVDYNIRTYKEYKLNKV